MNSTRHPSPALCAPLAFYLSTVSAGLGNNTIIVANFAFFAENKQKDLPASSYIQNNSLCSLQKNCMIYL